MGHSDVASYLALGYNWLKVPEVVRFDLHGELVRRDVARQLLCATGVQRDLRLPPIT